MREMISLSAMWGYSKKAGLPWWRSGWESACQCRGHGFEPWSGKIPHAMEQLGPRATTTEPARLEPVLPTREAAIVRGPRTAMKSGPHLPQLEKALAQKRRPNTAKNKLINFKKLFNKKRRQPSAKQEESSHQDPNQPMVWSWTSQPP